MPVTYRPASTDERESFYQLMLRQSEDYIDESLRAIGLTRDQFYNVFCTLGEVWAVRDESDAAGFYWIETRGSVMHIHALILEESAQGKGLGKKVLTDLEAGAGSEIQILEAGVHESNDRARRLCERRGFVQEACRNDVGFLIYRKQLPPNRQTGMAHP